MTEYSSGVSEINSEEFNMVVDMYGRKIREMGDGEMFGESALEQSTPRTGTVVCLQTTEMLVLEREDFLRCVKTKIKNQREQKVNLINKIFGDLNFYSHNRIHNILYSFDESRFTKGCILTNESEKRNLCFLIKKGTCNIKKTFNPNWFVRWISSCNSLDIDANDIAVFKKFQSSLISANNLNQETVIGTVQTGELIGEEAMYSSQGLCLFTYEVTSIDCQVYAINVNSFEKLIPLEIKNLILRLFIKKLD